jgi:V8-like Glu-specific endopeptidase/cell wall-associated NlpC family hydrolase
MPRIQANRDSIDDRFSVLGFTVRTESPLFEVAVATDPNLFKPENRTRRARANFYSSRAHGVTRARRGEAVYLVPPDVLGNFVGQPRLYFGLATYRENSRGTPDFVQAPSDSSMYVSLRQLTERGLRRSLAPQAGSSYGQANGRDPSLDWGGDMVRNGAASTPAAPGAPAATAPNGGAGTASQPAAPTTAVAQAYDDGFGAFPEHEAVAGALDLLLRDYNGGLLEQLRFFGESVSWFAGVTDTRNFPHSAICQVFDPAIGPEGERGTAFYIGRNLLLTAAHVVDGVSNLIIVPGKNGQGVDTAHEPFGRFNVSSANWRKHESYVASSRDFDFAIIKTPNAAPGGRWFNLLEELRQSRPEGVAVCGYSVRSRNTDLVARLVNRTIDTRKQHLHAGAVRTVANETFTYDIQTLPGASGSPVYWIESGVTPRAHLVGVHVAGGDNVTNKGCRLTDAKIAWIRARAAEFGQSNAMEIDDEVLAEELAIPLDPGAGGRSIGVSALQPGDIIVSTTRQFVSRAIRLGTLSVVSHTMLYAGDGKVIESIGSGVREVTLAAAIDDAILAVAYRHPSVDAAKAAQIVAYARTRIGNPYNYAGVAYQGYRILNPLPAAVIDAISRRLHVEVGQAGAVYCSELVLESYERAGVPLTSTRPGQSTPSQVVNIARSNMSYVGHLKAEDVPLGIPLGLPDAMDTTLGNSFSVHWNDVPLYAQTSNASCWAAAAAMIVSWRDQVSISDQSIASKVPVFDAYKRGLFPSERRPLSDAWNLVPEPPASYTIEAWCRMLQTGGPIYIDMNWSPGAGGHARVLVGMTSGGAADGSDTVMYMHDPWPGTPGRIKLTFAEFLRLYEGRVGNSGGQLQYQILHSASVPPGRRTVTAAPFSLALADELEPPVLVDAERQPEAKREPEPVAKAQAAATPAAEGRAMPAPPPLTQQPESQAQAAPVVVPIASAITGATMTRVMNNVGDITWELDQLRGLKHPNDQAPSPVPAFQDGAVIRLTDWPKFDVGGVDEISAGFQIAWQHNGKSLGNVQISNVATNDAVGWGLHVKAQIMDDNIVYPRNNPQFAALRIRFDYRFSAVVGSDRLAYREIHLFANGSYNLAGDWTQNTFL